MTGTGDKYYTCDKGHYFNDSGVLTEGKDDLSYSTMESRFNAASTAVINKYKATTQITARSSSVQWKYVGATTADQASKNYQGTKSGQKPTMLLYGEPTDGSTYFVRSDDYNCCIYTIWGYTYNTAKTYRLYEWASLYKGANKHDDGRYYWNTNRAEWYGSLDIVMQKHTCKNCGALISE